MSSTGNFQVGGGDITSSQSWKGPALTDNINNV